MMSWTARNCINDRAEFVKVLGALWLTGKISSGEMTELSNAAGNWASSANAHGWNQCVSSNEDLAEPDPEERFGQMLRKEG